MLYAFIAVLLISPGIDGQVNKPIVRHITTADGLVSNHAGLTIQDSKGYVWIGTQTGLQRYDGKRFKTYLADVRDPNALQSDWITTLFEDSKHRLWIGSPVKGPCVLDRSTDSFYNFDLHSPAAAKKIGQVWQFLEDKKGRIWIAAHDTYYWFNESTKRFESAAGLLKMERNCLPIGLTLDNKGRVWFATTCGVKMLPAEGGQIVDSKNNPQRLPVFDLARTISSVSFDKNDNIWLSTGYDHDLFRYNEADRKMSSYFFYRLKETVQPGLPEQKEYLGKVFVASTGQVMVPLFSRGIAFYNAVADSFTVMNADNNDPLGIHLQRNAYSSIALNEDKEKNIWVTTDAGLNIYNLQPPAFTTYTNASASASGEISGALQVANGDIYIANYFASGGISQYDARLNLKQNFLWKGKFNYEADENQVWGVFQDRKGKIWAPNQAGNILQLDPATSQLTRFTDTALHGSVNQVLQDADNNTWIAHDRRGLFVIEAGTGKIKRFRDFYNPAAATRRQVMCMLPDNDKLWVGTLLHGLQLFDKRSGKFINSFMADEKDKNSITDNNVTSIIQYSADTLIIGTRGGINIFDKKRKIFSAIMSKDGLPNNLVESVILDDQKNVWAAFAGGLSRINLRSSTITNYDANDGIIDNRFTHSFTRLSDGRLLIGGSASFLVFDPAKISSSAIPENVTITGFRVDGKPVFVDSFVNTTIPVELSYHNNSINIELAGLQFSSPGGLKYYYMLEGADTDWARAGEDHAVSFNQLPPGKYIFKVKVSNRDGIFSKNITTLAINIIPPFWETWWFAVLAGLLIAYAILLFVRWRERKFREIEAGRTKLQQLTAENYKSQFESEQISSFFTTSLMNKNDVDDVLWDVAKNLIGKLGFVDCVIYLWNEDKTKMVQKAGYGPKGSLEQFQEKHFDVLPGQGIVGTVIASNEALLIPDTSTDERYRVDDIARLSELCVPIKYNEQLLGVIDSEHHEKNFFTRQHLQVLSTIATLVASKIKAIEADQRLRHQKAQLADINDRLAEVQLNALRGQMNPHFIFNALNSIKKFVIANEPANAEKYLGKFSKLIRSILDNSRSGMVTIEKELQLLRLYLDLEKLRFGSKLNYVINVDERLATAALEMPSMIVQPFVENAMLHGIMHLEDDGQVIIDFILHDEWLEIVIEDNGVGRKKSAAYKNTDGEEHHSIGIEVATKRLEALKKNEGTPAGIRIIDLLDKNGEGAGTKVIISIPVF